MVEVKMVVAVKSEMNEKQFSGEKIKKKFLMTP